MALQSVGQLAQAAIDPELVGVWRTSDSMKLRAEFKADGSMSTWLEKKKGRAPLGVMLKLKDLNKAITMIDDQHFRIGKGEKAGYFRYQVTLKNPDKQAQLHRHRLEFFQVNKDLSKIDRNASKKNKNFPLDLNAIKFVLHKVNFRDPAQTRLTGDFQTHKNLSLESRLMAAIQLKKIDAIGRLLESDDAAFLTAAETKTGIAQGRNWIRSRLWDTAANTYDEKIITAFYQGFPEGYRAVHLNRAMKNKKPNIVALYKRLTGTADSGLTVQEKSQLQFVLSAHAKLVVYALSQEHLISDTFGCRKANIDFAAVNRMKLGEIKPDAETQARLDWGREQQKRLQKDWSTYLVLVEKEFKHCLQQGYQGAAIPKKILGSRTTPGEGISYSTTPLYFYASLKQKSRVKNSVTEGIMRYAAINALLDLGADPTIRPTKDSMSLADHMFIQADHSFFRQALKSRQSEKHPMMAVIKKYNEIMKKIGGPEYDPNASPHEVFDKHKAGIASGATSALKKTSQAAAIDTNKSDTGSRAKPTKQTISKLTKPVIRQTTNPAKIEKTKKTPAPYEMPAYWHARIVTVDPAMPLDPAVRALWKKGMYFHFKRNGVIGFNTESPGPYIYLAVNKWKKSTGKVTLTLTDTSYTFALPKTATAKPLVTQDNQKKQFEMTLVGKDKGKM